MRRNGTVISITLKIIICIVLCMVIMQPFPRHAYAEGGINSNEARVLAAARGSFQYEGETYVARQYYVDQLVSSLSSEDVNLTSKQADAAISAIYSNVGTGVESGYIVKAGSQEDDLDKNQKDEVTEESPEEKDGDNNVVQKPEGKDDDLANAESTHAPAVVNKNDDGTFTVEDGNGNVILQFDGVLKNTGFSYRGTVVLIILLGVIISCVLIYSAMVIMDTGKR